MPPKKNKNVEMSLPTFSIASETSLEEKPMKQKPLTKRGIEKMKRMEKEMREKLILMKKEAEDTLADYHAFRMSQFPNDRQAMENAALLKAQQEEEQQNLRVQILTGTCETFETAKARLVHELNKIREEEIWKRYTTTDQKPYPESTQNMHDHLYLWKQQKVTENIDKGLKQCDTYMDTLDLLNELIEYPLYSSKQTVANWKELRTEWRNEILDRIDQCCFQTIKNLDKNFNQRVDQNQAIYSFDFETNHLKLGLSAWTENTNVMHSLKWTPKITFDEVEAEFTMPAAFRNRAFILRLIYLDRDFFSDDSLTFNVPLSLPLETNMLKEVNRCFEAKNQAKASVADREREKVKAAKQKYEEAQEAANQLEKTFKSLQVITNKFKTKKASQASVKSDGELEVVPIADRRKKPPPKRSLATLTEGTSQPERPEPSNAASKGRKRRGGPTDVAEPSNAARILQSAGAVKTLDTISMRSGMRRKQDKMKKCTIQDGDETDPSCIFKTRSMKSLKHFSTRTIVRKDSALCFEETDLSSAGSLKIQKVESYDSLDLMLGKSYEDDLFSGTTTTLRKLIRETEIVEHESQPNKLIMQRMASKTMSSYSCDGKKRRGRGKSFMSLDKKSTGEEEIPPSASELFEAKEDFRQDQYLTSMYFQAIPRWHFHLNLRMYSVVGGTYLLELINHVPQPHQLPNGTLVQIFYGPLNVQREKYEYTYVPPPPLRPGDDPDEQKPDLGLQNLLHVKIPLPKHVVYFGQPEVALWDRDNQFWTKENVHNLEIDIENKIATFSLSKIMPFAFFLKKFSLIPYKSWNLKPKFDGGGVTLTIRTMWFATIEFHVSQFKVSLIKAVTPEERNIIELGDIIGKEMQLHKLIATMKSRGVNVFPDEDACLYTENTAKDVILEDHTNLSIAMWSDSLEFQGCEWNGMFGRRKLAFRVRESLPYNLELRYRTIVASSQSTMIYRQGTEDSSFDESKVEGYGFSPDVSTILEKAFCHVAPCNPVNPQQVLCVYSLLSRTRVHSYCGITQKETLSSSSEESKKGLKKRHKKIKQRNRKATRETTRSSADESAVISESSSSNL